MKPFATNIILTNTAENTTVKNRYRLIETLDATVGDDVYSVFLTSRTEKEINEEFLYDIARDRETAEDFFNRICKNEVTARTLFEVAEDFLIEKDGM